MNRIENATNVANATRPNAFEYSRAALSPQAHDAVIGKIKDGATYDVVVIGAGVTGAGVALDAATRGLSVLLVDKHDLAFGTSRWSSKLAHGGLRYLASFNFGIARRSAQERGILMEVTAPHLTKALGQVVPVMKQFSLANNVLPRMGFFAGDALRIAAHTSSSTLPLSRIISAERVGELCPAADVDNIKFGYLNYDGQLVDDAALVTAIVRTAAGFGADVLTHCACESIEGTTVNLEDGLTVTARHIVNATGVWAGDLDHRVTVTPSRGSHVVVDAELLGNPTGALTVPVEGYMNRFCFILPAPNGRCYIGLTDELAPMEEEPHAPESDIEFVLGVVNRALKVKLTRDDVIGTFAGLRPLVTMNDNSNSKKKTADLSREHLILEDGPLITITGGKLTEYRLMAEQVVDRITDAPCVTARTPLIGAPARPEDPTADTSDRFAFAISHEGARTVEDILDRRTRIGLVEKDRTEAEPRARQALADAGLLS